MKRARRRLSYRGSIRAFTLLEVLVVVSIIAILVVLLSPAILRIREKGRRTVAMDHIKQLEAAFNSYFEEYRKWPTGLSANDTGPNVEDTAVSGVEVQDGVVRMLKGEDINGMNPRLIPFMQLSTNQLSAGANIDPWDNRYRYMLDFNNDGWVKVRFTGSGSTNLLRYVAVWSLGRDGSDDPARQTDDVRSW